MDVRKNLMLRYFGFVLKLKVPPNFGNVIFEYINFHCKSKRHIDIKQRNPNQGK